jgi:hypothetical protein
MIALRREQLGSHFVHRRQFGRYEQMHGEIALHAESEATCHLLRIELPRAVGLHLGKTWITGQRVRHNYARSGAVFEYIVE